MTHPDLKVGQVWQCRDQRIVIRVTEIYIDAFQYCVVRTPTGNDTLGPPGDTGTRNIDWRNDGTLASILGRPYDFVNILYDPSSP